MRSGADRASSKAVQRLSTRANVLRIAEGSPSSVAASKPSNSPASHWGKGCSRNSQGRYLLYGRTRPVEREEEIEEPGDRLCGVEPALKEPTIALVLQGAIRKVDPTVESVVLDED